MKKIQITTPSRKYLIYITAGLFKSLPRKMKELGKEFSVISDNNVGKLYGQQFSSRLITFPAGEGSKNLQQLETLAKELVKKRITRYDFLIALGGGVTGDLVGFLASVYMRGINFIQVPTSLLAMVDSSIGGKTAINLSSGKNLIGTFYQPQTVYIDPLILKTLPTQELSNGFAEVIKQALLDGHWYHWLEENQTKVKKLDPEIMTELISHNCRFKARVVSQDERDVGLRRILNLGHTFAHAVELLSEYRINHGQAVAYGLVKALELSDYPDLSGLKQLLSFFDLETTWPREMTGQKVIKAMMADKKKQQEKITLVLLPVLGQPEIIEDFPINKVIEVIDED